MGRKAFNSKCHSTFSSKHRVWLYRCLALFSMLLFICFRANMHLVPGLSWPRKVFDLFLAASALVICLGVGAWRPRHGDAPIMNSRTDGFLAAILMLQLAYCIGGILAIVIKMQWYG